MTRSSESKVVAARPVFAELAVGMVLPELAKQPTAVQLFRYSAITWNAHRIHYDKDYAAVEGYPDVLVQSHLHGAFLTQLCTDWMGHRGRLRELELSVKRFAVPGEVLTCTGEISALRRDGDQGVVTVELAETNPEGQVCAPGRAVIELPLVEE
jgi:acyl dehydratase